MKIFVKFLLSYLIAFSNAFAGTQVIHRADIIENTASVKNYLGAQGHFEKNVNGVNAFADAAAATPVDMTGGSPNTTCTRTTSSPLSGDGSLLITKAGSANRQGEGCSIDFSIDVTDEGKVLQGIFDYAIASGTYVSNDIDVWVYDVTNSALIAVAPLHLLNHTLASDKFAFEFQTASNSTSYRVGWYIASTSTSNYTVKIDNAQIGRLAQKLYGSAATDWVTYGSASDFVGFGTATLFEMASRRVGDTLEIKGKVTIGTSTSTEARLRLGFGGVGGNVTSADTTKIQSIQVAGYYERNVTGVSVVKNPLLIEPSVGYLTFGIKTSTDAPLTKQNGNAVFSAGETFSFKAEVPILGWGSSQVLSTDADTRSVLARATGTPATVSAGNPVIFPTITYDTHGGYSASTGRFTVPVPGYYRECISVNSSTASESYKIYKNAAADVEIMSTNTAQHGSGCGTISVIAGDILDIRPIGAGSGTMGGGGFISFEKIQGPAQVAASESVNARYFASSTSVSGSLATISWTTKDFDSHGGMSSGTYTVPSGANGKYQVNVGILISATFALNSTVILEIQKNGTVVNRYTIYAGGIETAVKAASSDLIGAIGGDTIRAQVSTSGTGSPAIVSSNYDNYFSIARVGN